MAQDSSSLYRDFLIGLVLAISSCFFIGGSFIFKKFGLLRLRNTTGGVPAAEGGYGYLRDWVWWTGFLTMGVGEGFNFAAYAFAPASLVTPLGALSILVAAVLAQKFLHENLNIFGKLGCMLCILGSIVIIIHSPKDQDVKSVEELNDKIFHSGFLYYIAIITASAILVSKYFVPRYGQTNVICYIYICSSIGSLSVMCCKGLGLCIREALSGNRPLINYTFIFFIASLAICITVQLNYLNKALDTFNTNIVNPIHYVFFTSFVILASSILFSEWQSILFVDAFATIVGLLIVIIALVMLNAFKDLQYSLTTDYNSQRKTKNLMSSNNSI